MYLVRVTPIITFVVKFSSMETTTQSQSSCIIAPEPYLAHDNGMVAAPQIRLPGYMCSFTNHISVFSPFHKYASFLLHREKNGVDDDK